MTKIIAELCQNHNGSFELVERMIESAVLGGATHVKLQSIFAKDLSFRPQFENGIFEEGNTLSIKRPWKAEYERLKKLELDFIFYKKFVDICKEYKVTPLTTCFTTDSAQMIYEQGFREVKVASYDCSSFHLLRKLIEKFPIIYVSTGASYDSEIEKANQILDSKGIEYYLLHCVTIYPTPLNQLHLNRLEWIKNLTSNIGFSDHTSPQKDGVLASCAAIACGAKVIERHFTILDKDETKDGPVSVTESQLKEISDFSKLSKTEMEEYLSEKYPDWKSYAMGSKFRKLSAEEILNRDYYRGRFATKRYPDSDDYKSMIFNWEEA